MGFNDDHLIELLRQGDFLAILEATAQNRNLLSRLTGLSYYSDPNVADRAVEAFGLAAAKAAETSPEFVRGHLRRLFWLLNDESGGIGWRAPEMIGETLARCPGFLDEFISPLAYLLDMEEEDSPRFRLSILKALDCIAAVRPQELSFARSLIRRVLTVDDLEAHALADHLLAVIPEQL